MRIPKRLFLYNGFVKLSYLRYLTVETFMKHNPDWEVVVFKPQNLERRQLHDTGEQKGYHGPDYSYLLKEKLGINQIPFDVGRWGLSGLAEVHKSDILRNWLVWKYGGFWSDFDILYLGPATLLDTDHDTLICHDGTFWYIGLFGGTAGNPFFGHLFEKSLSKARNNDYQCFGVRLYEKPSDYLKRFPRLSWGNLQMGTVYPFNWYKMKDVYRDGNILPDICFGIHWFGGSDIGNVLEHGLLEDKYLLMNTVYEHALPGPRKISIVCPCDATRLPQFQKTLASYARHSLDGVEFVVPTRDLTSVGFRTREPLDLRLVPYSWSGTSFNPVMALNLGVRAARHDNVIIQSPEVCPETDVIRQFRSLPRGNYVAQVWDHDPAGARTLDLSSAKFIKDLAGRYFLAMFKREDLWTVNGWNLDYMGGYCWDDNEFGRRFASFASQGLVSPVTFRDDIIADHLYHPRCGGGETPEWLRNKSLFMSGLPCKRGIRDMRWWQISSTVYSGSSLLNLLLNAVTDDQGRHVVRGVGETDRIRDLSMNRPCTQCYPSDCCFYETPDWSSLYPDCSVMIDASKLRDLSVGFKILLYKLPHEFLYSWYKHTGEDLEKGLSIWRNYYLDQKWDHLVWYRDMVTDPRRCVSSILEATGLDANYNPEWNHDHGTHIVGGNPAVTAQCNFEFRMNTPLQAKYEGKEGKIFVDSAWRTDTLFRGYMHEVYKKMSWDFFGWDSTKLSADLDLITGLEMQQIG